MVGPYHHIVYLTRIVLGFPVFLILCNLRSGTATIWEFGPYKYYVWVVFTISTACILGLLLR